MFDCINCFLPTSILEHFTTNATIHAHHTRQRIIPHVTETFGTTGPGVCRGSISKRAVTHKGPKIWTEIPQTIRLRQNIFPRLMYIPFHHHHMRLGVFMSVSFSFFIFRRAAVIYVFVIPSTSPPLKFLKIVSPNMKHNILIRD